MKLLNDEIIDKYLLGECSEEELQEINSCIKESKNNARRLFDAEELFCLGKNDYEIDEERIDQAQKKLFKKIREQQVPPKKTFHLYKFMQYAAILIATVFICGGIYFFNNREEDLLTASADDQIKSLTLSDGTNVWLNQHSTLKYPQEFTGRQRVVILEGEAYFEVSKNEHKPFIVKNEAMNVRVLGTVFNLKNDKSCHTAEATLVEGQIEVTSNLHNGNVVLSPGQRAELNKSNGLLTVKQVNAKIDVAWHNDMISFRKANILDICQTLEKIYNIKIILSSDIQSDKTYTGSLKKRSDIESMLNSLQNAVPFTYKIKNNHVFISPI